MDLIRIAPAMLLTTLLNAGNRFLDTIFLRHLSTPTELGNYAAAVKLSELTYIFPVILGTTVLPFLIRSREDKHNNLVSKLTEYYAVSALYGYTVCIAVIIAAQPIIEILYGPAYINSARILQIHILGTIFISLEVARTQCMVANGSLKFAFIGTGSGCIVNIILNSLLIPRHGGEGAAIATVASYCVSGFLSSLLIPGMQQQFYIQGRALIFPQRGLKAAWRYYRQNSK